MLNLKNYNLIRKIKIYTLLKRNYRHSSLAFQFISSFIVIFLNRVSSELMERKWKSFFDYFFKDEVLFKLPSHLPSFLTLYTPLPSSTLIMTNFTKVEVRISILPWFKITLSTSYITRDCVVHLSIFYFLKNCVLKPI